MGQVPEKAAHTYGIVGDGKMASHMRAYFDALGVRYSHWARSHGTSPSSSLRDCSIVLLLISDSAIEPFIRANSFLLGKTLVHFSGSLVTAFAAGAHPLMSFGPELLTLDRYRGIPFIYEQGRINFKACFPFFSNPAYPIAPHHKPYYHALCVLSGNFTVVLWRKLFKELTEKMGIPSEAALPFLRQVARNLEADPKTALTGPFQRRDAGTIRRNLSSLSGDPFEPVYRAFAQLMMPEALHDDRELPPPPTEAVQ